MKKLSQIFKNNVIRPIQGVINVDDITNKLQELNEYVLTNDIVNQLSRFFENFNESIGVGKKSFAMACWISGYFGSGKSHFLKILSYLLENKEIDGKKPYEFFEDKLINDKNSDPIVFAQIKRAAEVSKDVILFNIDSKTQSNVERDKIVNVFERVFNEQIGYSHIPFVADFERQLDDEGKYEEFKNNYKKISGKNWDTDRRFFISKMDEITKTYMKTLNKSEKDADYWYNHIQDSYSVTIEEFAKKVVSYIEKKGNDHHVIFMIDEVGQFMSGDDAVALNLQSIVEELGRCCGGKSWVIVTSQEDISSFIKILKNDYSKNQDRFQTKISLSSRDVAEVIKKRLLAKNIEDSKELIDLYDKEVISINNLLSFVDATTLESQIYENKEDFAETYPFIPYQFRLVQSTFIDVREQKYAREHLSSGERSLLGAFQDAIKKYVESDIGTIIPFYSFYDTIENFLNHQIKLVFAKAEDLMKNKTLDELSLKILKVLFMIKNTKGLPGSVENISTLCIDNIYTDKLKLKNDILESLKKLKRENLAEEIDGEYRFLTNDEQEVNKAINSIVPDESAFNMFLYKRIFEVIYQENKYRYIDGQDFNFMKMIDDKNMKGIEYDIGINIWTGTEGDKTKMNMMSSINNNILYIDLDLPKNVENSIYNILKVEKFVRDNRGIEQRKEIEDIINSKSRLAEKEEKKVTERLREILKIADMTITGNTIVVNKQNVKERIDEGLKTIVKNVYSKLSYIETNFSSKEIREIYAKKNDSGNISNKLAYDDMIEFLKEQSAFSKTTTVKLLLQKYSSKPYGFIDEDIIYIIVKLLKNEIINIIYAGNNLDTSCEDTINKLLNRQNYEKLIIKLREKVSLDIIVKIKNFMKNEFSIVDIPENEDKIINTIIDTFKNYSDKMREVIGRYQTNKSYMYPGRDIIEESIKYFDLFKTVNRDPHVFFTEFMKAIDRLKYLHTESEGVVEFFEGNQVNIFNRAVDTTSVYLNNAQFLSENSMLVEKFNELDNILKNDKPYSDIQRLETIRQDLVKEIGNIYNNKSEPVIDDINKKQQSMNDMIKNVKNNKSLIELVHILDISKEKLNKTNELRDIYAESKHVEDVYNDFLDEYESIWTKEQHKDNGDKPSKITKHIRIKNIITLPAVIKNKQELEDKYLNVIKEKILKELDEGNEVEIIL